MKWASQAARTRVAAHLRTIAGPAYRQRIITLQRLLDARGDQLGADDEDLLLIRRNLVESFQRYERAQQQLMDILRGDDATDSSSAGSGGS